MSSAGSVQWNPYLPGIAILRLEVVDPLGFNPTRKHGVRAEARDCRSFLTVSAPSEGQSGLAPAFCRLTGVSYLDDRPMVQAARVLGPFTEPPARQA